MKFSLPEGWTGIIDKPKWKKPYGWCSWNNKHIIVNAPKWIPSWFGLRSYFETIIWNHEVLHAWGNRGCSNIWCLGYESSKWKEYLAMLVQLIVGLRFCKDCISYYNKKE